MAAEPWTLRSYTGGGLTVSYAQRFDCTEDLCP